MKRSDLESKFSRRGFLVGGAVAVAALLAESSPSVALEAQGLKPEEDRTLVKFVRDLFPHDRLEDTFYANAIKPLQEEASKDPAVKRLLAEGIAQLNRMVGAAGAQAYADLGDENKRVAVIKQIERGPFFKKVYSTTIVSLYGQSALWPKFGYEGPSSPKGGYLHRGFSDLDWL